MPNSPDDDPEFLQWRQGLPFFDLDGERFYLPSGDVPMDEEQIIEIWERRRPAGSPDAAPDRP